MHEPDSNSDDSISNLRVADSVDDAIRAELMKQLDAAESWPVDRDLGDLRRPAYSLDPALIPVINLAVAITAFGYTLYKDWRNRAKWTDERLREHLQTELIARGVVDFEIVEVNNFDEFRKGKSLCVVQGVDKKGKAYKVWLFLKGDIAVLEVQQ